VHKYMLFSWTHSSGNRVYQYIVLLSWTHSSGIHAEAPEYIRLRAPAKKKSLVRVLHAVEDRWTVSLTRLETPPAGRKRAPATKKVG